MCVICHKPKEAKLPSAEDICAMWDANPHGAGVMWREGGRVRYVKGFMDKDVFMKWLEANREALDATECALHFRITTHGGTNPQNTHPFPLDRHTNPHALTGCCKRVLMHNGIMPLTPRDPKYSDTAEYTIRAKESGDAARYVKSTAEWVGQSNRLCVFLPRETLLVGDWKTRNGDGCNYSNLNWERNGFDEWWREYNVASTDAKASSKATTWTLDDGDGALEEQQYGYYFSERSGCWKDRFGCIVPIDYVDPDALSPEDQDLYYDMLNEEPEWGFNCDKEPATM